MLDEPKRPDPSSASVETSLKADGAYADIVMPPYVYNIARSLHSSFFPITMDGWMDVNIVGSCLVMCSLQHEN